MINKIICWLFGHQARLSIIRKGRNIIVDRGIEGKDNGIFLSIDGYSCFGRYGMYKNEKGKIRIWDESVHSVYPKRLTNWEIYRKSHCPRCEAKLK